MRWLSKETRKEDTEVQDNTELGREFQRATVDGRKDCNLRCVLQRGIASVSLRKDCLARTETQVGSCARRAGGPWPCISFHSRTNFKRRLLQASVGHPIISRTTEFDATRRPFFTIALATDSWSRSSASASAFVHESQTGLAYSKIGLTTVMNMCLTKPSARHR